MMNCYVYTSEPIDNLFQQKTYDSSNHDGLCCWLAIAMMIQPHEGNVSSKMISLNALKLKTKGDHDIAISWPIITSRGEI